MEFKSTGIKICIIFGLLLLLTSCAIPEETLVTNPDVLLQIEVRGGRCTYGMCNEKIIINNDGKYFSNHRNGSLPDFQIIRIQENIVKTDFVEIKSKPFSGNCPTTYDGSEYVFTFYTPSKHEIPTCTYNIDLTTQPFKYLLEIFSEISNK